MKLWKVVTKDRESALIKRPRYQKTYRKGSVVRMTKGSLGVFCFPSFDAACRFLSSTARAGSKVIEVESMGKILPTPLQIMAVYGGGVRIPTKVWRMCLRLIRARETAPCYYEDENEVDWLVTDPVWEGTVFYEAVRVLT